MPSCFERACGSCAQICGPPAVICFLISSYVSKAIFVQIEPVLSYLGERIHILELVGMLGWGIWIMTLGMTYLGLAFMVLAIMPGWPYALYDYAQGEDRHRILRACVGLHHLQEYEGAAASPEMGLLSTVLAKVPLLAVIAVASAEGRDVLVSGLKENGLLRFVTLAYAFLSGINIASSSYACVDAVKDPSQPELGLEEALAHSIDGWISRAYTYLIHAVDTLTAVTVVGAVGGHCDRETFGCWLLGLWLCTGLLPALAAPPPMPTLRPALPKRGIKAWCHKLAVSILLIASPPTEFMPMLRVTKQRIWAAATLLRAVWLLASGMAVPTLQRPLFAGLEVIHVVVVGGLSMALVAWIRLLHAEVKQKPHSFLSKRDSFFSVDNSYDVVTMLHKPLIDAKPATPPAPAPVSPIAENPQEAAERDSETSRQPEYEEKEETPVVEPVKEEEEEVEESTPDADSVQDEGEGFDLEAAVPEPLATAWPEVPESLFAPEEPPKVNHVAPPRGFWPFCCPDKMAGCTSMCTKTEIGEKDLLT
ncbi:unnamed protein product [Effrenium voratum]|nr:unnamed protein product [Effrenium voratum]